MVYTFARINAVVAMEKGARLKRHEMPAQHKLDQFLDEYLAAAGIRDHEKAPSSAWWAAEPGC